MEEEWVGIFWAVKLSGPFYSVHFPVIHIGRDHNAQEAPIGTKKRFTWSQFAAQPHVGLIEGKTLGTLHRASWHQIEKHQSIVFLNWMPLWDLIENNVSTYLAAVYLADTFLENSLQWVLFSYGGVYPKVIQFC